MNTELLHKIIAYFEEDPRRLDMGVWITTDKDSTDPARPPCGTTACIAGAAIILAGRQDEIIYPTLHHLWTELGTEVLQLSLDQGHRLFYCLNWSSSFKRGYQNSSSPKEALETVKSRILHFIETES